MKLALPVVLLLAAAASAQREPFPTSKSIKLKENGRRWTLDGRHELPSRVRVESLKSTVIEGGQGENVIELSGTLVLRSPVEGRVELHGIWIELQPDAEELWLSHVDFIGGGIRSAGDGVKEPKVFIEFCTFDANASVSMTLYGGQIDLQQTSIAQPVSFVGLPIAEKIPNKASVGMLSCRGLASGLAVEGIAEVLVRNCDLAGVSLRFANWLELEFDGNNVRTALVEFELPSYGRFTTADIHNCDFQCDEIAFACPPDGEKAEKYTLDHCYFRGMTDPRAIVETMIVDHTRDPKVGVEITAKRVARYPLGLGGAAKR